MVATRTSVAAVCPIFFVAVADSVAAYSVRSATFDAQDNYRCRGTSTTVFYPEAAGSFPVVVYAHGQGGARPNFEGCATALETVASHGLIVLAPMTEGHVPGVCDSASAWEDVFHALDVAQTHGRRQVPALDSQADWSSLAVWGFSMGAKAATRAAGRAGARGVTFAALVASHGARESDKIPTHTDTMYVTGTEDFSSSPPGRMFKQYKKNPAASKVYANLEGHPHTEACADADPPGQGLMNAWVAKFLRCSLAGEYCDEVYQGPLCAANAYKTCVVRGPRSLGNASRTSLQPILV